MAKRYNIQDLIDKQINYLTVLSEGEPHITKGGNIHRTIICRCKCGKIKTTQLSSILNNSVKSCGCYSAEIASNRMKTFSKKHGLYKTKEYNTWLSMKKRCLNYNHKSYNDYGGRGIIICDTWVNSFENFINDMGFSPTKEHSLDRIDNSKGYYKDNCRWATKKEQCRNVRNNIIFTYDNKSLCVGEWVEILNMNRYKAIKFLTENGQIKH